MRYPKPDEQKKRRLNRNGDVSSQAHCFLGMAVNRETIKKNKIKKKHKTSKLENHKNLTIV